MPEWFKSLFAAGALPGVRSRRLVSVVFGAVLLAWLRAALPAGTLPELPASVLALLVITLGTVALDRP
jgi:hypothetical protein